MADKIEDDGITPGNKNEYFQTLEDNNLKGKPEGWSQPMLDLFWKANRDFWGSEHKTADHVWAKEQLAKAIKRQEELSAAASKEEYQSAMLAAMAEMQAASQQKLPYQQPASAAQENYSAAQTDAANRQLLRRGLLSLTRWGSGSGASQGGISGKSTTLGG